GVETQSNYRQQALHVPTKTEYVRNYQRNTVQEAMRIIASLGVDDPSKLHTDMLRRNRSEGRSASYSELYTWLAPGQLLADPPAEWARDWKLAKADHLGPGLDAAAGEGTPGPQAGHSRCTASLK